VRHTESGIWRFWPLPHAGYENPEADTHVDFLDDVLSDAGSTPAASTIPLSLRWFGLGWQPTFAIDSASQRVTSAEFGDVNQVRRRTTQVRQLGWRRFYKRPVQGD